MFLLLTQTVSRPVARICDALLRTLRVKYRAHIFSAFRDTNITI